MSEQTILVDPELARQALGDVLESDAASQPAAAPPPRRQPPPDATPEAPWGFKADGSPRKGPPGPGRPRKDADSQPRTAAAVAEPSPSGGGDTKGGQGQAAASSEDYSETINDAITTVWMGMALIPWTQAHAAIVKAKHPELVPAWNAAAQQNPTVRKYVLKLSGEGSWAWVIPVTVATTPLVLGFWEVTRNKQLRAELRAQTQQDWAEFITAAAASQGLELEAPAPESLTPTSSPDSSSSRSFSTDPMGSDLLPV